MDDERQLQSQNRSKFGVSHTQPKFRGVQTVSDIKISDLIVLLL